MPMKRALFIWMLPIVVLGAACGSKKTASSGSASMDLLLEKKVTAITKSLESDGLDPESAAIVRKVFIAISRILYPGGRHFRSGIPLQEDWRKLAKAFKLMLLSSEDLQDYVETLLTNSAGLELEQVYSALSRHGVSKGDIEHLYNAIKALYGRKWSSGNPSEKHEDDEISEW